jgi:hypothetical protein
VYGQLATNDRSKHWFRWLSAAVCLLAASAAQAQLRVASWNVTNYNGGRVADIQTSVYGVYQGRSMSPDVIIAQEFINAAAVTTFKNALNSAAGSPGDWAATTFVDGPDTDSTCFYRTSKVTLLEVVTVATGGVSPNHPRNIMRYDVRLVGYTSAGATLACYSTHMKAGDTGDDQSRRLLEAQRIRANAQTLDPAWQFVLGGDFNIPSSAQAAYDELVSDQPNNAGRFFDPINTPGAWNNNSNYTFVHTQDPIGAGGMDDRFDQILVKETLLDGDGFDYIGEPAIPYSSTTWNDPNHSYRAWGNDGTSFNSTLTTTGNTMVGAAIAQSLINVAVDAGHLPVFLDLRVPPEVGSDTTIDFGEVPQSSSAQKTLTVWNDGNVTLWTTSGIADLHYGLTASAGFSAPGGQFADSAGGTVNQHTLTMDTAVLGPKSGTLTIASNAPDQPSRQVTLLGTVIPGWQTGDLNCDGDVNGFDIDPFVLALTNATNYHLAYPNCDRNLADCDHDGLVNGFDIDPFIQLIIGK